MRRRLFEDLHEDFRASFRTFLEREVVGEQGRYGEWERAGIVAGERSTAIAMTEPGMGSDLASMSTRARRDGDEYVVDGAKTFITNGINADLVITAVKTGAGGHENRHRDISLVVIERGMEGFERGRNLEKVGQHAQDTAELSFSQVRVPIANLLGEEGEGFRYLVS